MAAAIEQDFPDSALNLIPGDSGDFIVQFDGETIWDKRSMNDQFPADDQILEKLRS